MIKTACIGDSITSGFTLLKPRRNSYPSLLQKMLGSNDTKRRNWDPEIFRVWGIPLMGIYPETMEECVRRFMRLRQIWAFSA